MTEPSLKHPSLNIVIACGGTGGHLFPGIAVAQELKKRGHRVTLLISQKKVDAQASKNYGDLDFRTIEAIAMPKIPSLSLLGFGVRLYKAIRFSRHLLDEVEADVVIGMEDSLHSLPFTPPTARESAPTCTIPTRCPERPTA